LNTARIRTRSITARTRPNEYGPHSYP
jgi:hypothetical protein